MPLVTDGKPKLSDIDKAPENLPANLKPAAVNLGQEDWQSRFSKLSNDNFELKAENHRLNQRLETKTAIESLMEPYANKVFWFLCGYCFFAFVLLCLSGSKWLGFGLSDVVLSIVTGSTAVSAIGLVGLVIRGIFKSAEAGGAN